MFLGYPLGLSNSDFHICHVKADGLFGTREEGGKGCQEGGRADRQEGRKEKVESAMPVF